MANAIDEIADIILQARPPRNAELEDFEAAEAARRQILRAGDRGPVGNNTYTTDAVRQIAAETAMRARKPVD